MDFFSRFLSFANSRDGLLFKVNAANIEIDYHQTMSKITTQSFQPRNVLKCQIILMKNTTLHLLSGKDAHGSFSEGFFS